MKKVMLITKADAARLPTLYATENVPEDQKKVLVKLFSIQSDHTFYLCEYSDVAPDGTPRLAFGYTYSHGELEAGYISIDELDGLTFSRYNVPTIERDRYFDPMTVAQLKEKVRAGNRP